MAHSIEQMIGNSMDKNDYTVVLVKVKELHILLISDFMSSILSLFCSQIYLFLFILYSFGISYIIKSK